MKKASHPIEHLIDKSGMRCTVCNAPMGQCHCWVECPRCHWSNLQGEKCRNCERNAVGKSESTK